MLNEYLQEINFGKEKKNWRWKLLQKDFLRISKMVCVIIYGFSVQKNQFTILKEKLSKLV